MYTIIIIITIKTDPFDCVSNDSCGHLGWLLRDNRHLLRALSGARCFGDGTAVSAVDFADFYPCENVTENTAGNSRHHNGLSLWPRSIVTTALAVILLLKVSENH